MAIDFDGVLHPYSAGWTGSAPADEPPTEGALDFLQMLEARGYEMVVFSCRADHDDGLNGMLEWLECHGLAGFIKRVTHVKPPAFAYVDDRGVRFAGDWIDTLEQVEALAVNPVGVPPRA